MAPLGGHFQGSRRLWGALLWAPGGQHGRLGAVLGPSRGRLGAIVGPCCGHVWLSCPSCSSEVKMSISHHVLLIFGPRRHPGSPQEAHKRAQLRPPRGHRDGLDADQGARMGPSRLTRPPGGLRGASGAPKHSRATGETQPGHSRAKLGPKVRRPQEGF